MHGRQNAGFGWIGEEFGHFFEKLRQHAASRMLVSGRCKVSIKRPSESVELTLVILQKYGHKIVRIHIGIYFSIHIRPIMYAHGPKALAHCPIA